MMISSAMFSCIIRMILVMLPVFVLSSILNYVGIDTLSFDNTILKQTIPFFFTIFTYLYKWYYAAELICTANWEIESIALSSFFTSPIS